MVECCVARRSGAKGGPFVGEPTADGKPIIEKVRIAVENKSVITAHRNRTNRFDDLQIDNVNAPSIPRPNSLGINVDAEYQKLLDQVCSAYTARWHT